MCQDLGLHFRVGTAQRGSAVCISPRFPNLRRVTVIGPFDSKETARPLDLPCGLVCVRARSFWPLSALRLAGHIGCSIRGSVARSPRKRNWRLEAVDSVCAVTVGTRRAGHVTGRDVRGRHSRTSYSACVVCTVGVDRVGRCPTGLITGQPAGEIRERGPVTRDPVYPIVSTPGKHSSQLAVSWQPKKKDARAAYTALFMQQLA